MSASSDPARLAGLLARLVAVDTQNLRPRGRCSRAASGGGTHGHWLGRDAADSPLLRVALATSTRYGVTLPQPSGLTGGCDLGHFHAGGSVGLILDPRWLDQAHHPDEFVPKDDLA